MNILPSATAPPSSHDRPFDPSYGYDREALLAITPPDTPADFAEFWQATYASVRAQEVVFEKKDVGASTEKWDIFHVYFRALDSIRSGAWICAPKNGPIEIGIVVGHGYGGRELADEGELVENAVYIYPVSRGFHMSKHDNIPYNDSSLHVTHQIETKESYVIRGCVAELWYSASILQRLYPSIDDNLVYLGGSYGGGLGALMLPWDTRFKKGYLHVPTFGHHPIRLQCECNGSGEAVRQYHKEHPQVADVLQYYDAAIAASHIKIPMLVTPALFDPAVPPPGQFAVCNALAGETTCFIVKGGHFEYPEQQQETPTITKLQKDFFKSP